ncbi:MAG: hypothetical protein DI539_23665 [Flavobacterium psychrophilum]|nr:MAG: hypothetical protein DI539_23665 [Flavobacterium psychrophilum]
MSRIHLFEVEDKKWFPSFLRDYMTDFLQFFANKMGILNPVVPIIEQALRKSNSTTIIDLGSGGGGALIGLNRDLKNRIPELKIVLTDYFPNIDAFERIKRTTDNIIYDARSVDARNVPENLKGLRTLFLAFHHFKPDDAKLILQNAVTSGSSIAIFEASERSALSILAMLFSPISVLLTTPFIRPFKVGRIFFAYIVPIVPLFVCWDGVVSSLRTYSIDEMKELANQVKGAENYHWEINQIKSGGLNLFYMTGTAK